MIRAILGVVVSIVVMAALVWGLSVSFWFALGVDGMLLPGTFDGNIVCYATAIPIGFIGAIFGGWLCATISHSRTALIVFAALCFMMGLSNAVMHLGKPDPGPRPAGLTVLEAIGKRKEPAWFTFLMPVLGTPGALLGGRRVLVRR